MNIGMQTWGSNGDVRPLLALAAGLHEAGHQVTFVASSIDNKSYLPACRNQGIAYRQIPEYIDFDMEDFARRSFRMNPLQWLKALLDEVFLPYEREIYRAARRLVDENDAVIGHHLLYPLKLAARKRNRPHVSVTFCPAAIPALPQPPYRCPDLGPVVNRWQWRLFDGLFDVALKKRLGKLWQTEHIPIRHVLSDLLSSDTLDVVAVNPLFCPYRRQWPDLHHATGFLNLPEQAEAWTLPTTLADFLAAGDPPVYMTFGSLQQALPDWSMHLFTDSAKQAGCRAIIQTSSERYSANTVLDDCYFIGPHPHSPVFARCAAVIHHGGAGTTQTATRAGLPSVVVSFMEEQMFWGRQLHRLGLAPEPWPARRVTATRLAASIRSLLQAAPMHEAAERAGQQMRDHDGVNNAVKLIEDTVKKHRPAAEVADYALTEP